MYTKTLRTQRFFIIFLLVVLLTFTYTGIVHALTRNLSLTIAGTSEPGSSETPNGSSGNERPVLIGEVVTYSLNFEIDEGINNGVNIVVAIPDGMQYTGEPEDVSFNNDSGWLDVPSVTGGAASGADLTFDFGTINNTDVDANQETITITFDVIVNNIAANQDGTILAVNATLNNDSAPAETSETRSVKVIEPDLTLTVSQLDSYAGNSVTTGDAGDPIAYTIRLTNNGNAPAYRVDLTDFIPVSYVTQYGTYILTGSPQGTIFYVSSTGELNVLWSSINPGSAVSITVRTTVNNSVAPEDLWTNTADITYDSLPDDDGSDNNVPGLPGSTTGLRNDYAETATTPTYSVPTIDVVKQVEYPSFTPVATTVFPGGYSDSTSDPNTGISAHDTNNVDLTIGETLNFIITVTYPEGTTPDTYLIDLASPYNTGISSSVIELISAEIVYTGSNLSGTGVKTIGTIYNPTDINGDGDGSYIGMGSTSDDILNTPDGVVDDNDRIVVRVTARIDDEDKSGGAADALAGVSNDDGDISRNRIQVAWHNTGNYLNTNTTIDIVEPALTISKSTISGANLSAGDSAVFELTISNTGTAPAYTVMVRDDFPGGGTPYLAFDSVDAGNSTCDDIDGFGLFSGSADYMDFRVGQLNAGSSCTIRFSATVQNNIASDTTYTNTASISSYDSLSNSSGLDNRNYSGSGSVTSTFRTADTTLPVVTVPANITEEATAASGAAVTFSASATDDIDGSLTPTCSPASGSTFALGTTTVNCSATDSAGNTGSNSFTVTVEDTTNPTVSVPANITEEATGSSGAAVTFTVSASDIVDGSIMPTCDANSGDTFAMGTTTVNCSATDNAGNTGNNSFTITVQDTTNPTVNVPANITEEATGSSGAAVTFTVSASDIVDGSITPTCDANSGDTFAIGTTTVNCSATDNAGNTGHNSFTITVQDTTNPTISVPANITEEATGSSGTAVTFTVSASDIVDGSITPTCDANSGDTFVIGTTTVNCSVTDNAGNTGNNSFTITVQDSTGPTITVPANITEEAISPSGNSVTYNVTASDIVDGAITPTCSPVSGSTFSLGTTTVNCSATDSEGNPGSNSFTITIEDTTAPTVNIEQGASQPDPANSGPIVFDVVFSEEVSGFDNNDVDISGMAATPTIVVTGTGDTYSIEVSGMADGETVIATIPSDAAMDIANNGNAASTSTDNSVTYDTSGPGVTIEQSASQPDPANTTPIVFDVVFNEDVSGFDDSDVNISGMAATPTIVVTGSGDTYTVEVSGMADGETVTASIPSDAAEDGAGNKTLAASSVDNSVTYDEDSISIPTGGIIGEPRGKTIQNSGDYSTHFTSLVINFSESANNPPGDSDPDDVTNPNNYLIIQSGDNRVYDTTSCLAYSNNGYHVLGDDTQILVNSVIYDDVALTATVKINNGVPLTIGKYRLFLCGTTSITDLAGNSLNNGRDQILTFSIVQSLPDTGFAQGEVTLLSDQPAAKAYTNTSMTLDIPNLEVSMPIVSVPKTSDEWDVSWLGSSAGYLEGSAFPTWEGNTVITGHVWDAFNHPGAFADLKSLKYGDKIQIQAWGQTYTYEVRESKLISRKNMDAAFESETYDWLTLVTCENYTPFNGEYLYRRMVRAVLVSVK